jgi:cytochrome c oxidase subunit 3
MTASLPEHYATPAQLDETVRTGMWVFLATEAMLFGAVCAAYTLYRVWFPQAFALGSAKLDLALGTFNTAILLTSSLCMALADLTARRRDRKATLRLLALTALLGVAFLGIKFFEWRQEYHEHLVPLRGLTFQRPDGAPASFQLFFDLYYTMTGLHALHLGIGLGLVATMFCSAWRWRTPTRLERQMTVTGLYWHFVDIIWVLLYPLLYLL